MNQEFDQPCPICAKPMQSSIALCPACAVPSKPNRLSKYGAVIGGLALAVVAAATFIVGFQYLVPRKSADFADHAGEVRIIGFKHSIGFGNSWNVAIVGTIRNDSAVKWRELCLEVQCFDRNGSLVDTYSDEPHGLVLIPNTEQAFRISFGANRDPNDYAEYKVFLRDARDASRWE